MNRTVLLSAAGAAFFLSMGVTQQVGLRGRLATIEEASLRPRPAVEDSEIVRSLQRRIDELSVDLAAAAERSQAVELAVTGSATLQSEIAVLEAELKAAKETLANQSAELKDVTALARRVERIDEVEAGVDSRWDGFATALEAQAALVQETREELVGVRAQLGSGGTASNTDAGQLWLDMVGPTVQLAGDATVGSGVLLESREIPGKPDEYQTLLLTSWHVVRDIRADSVEHDAPIPVMLRDATGGKRHLSATLVGHDTALDSALLVIDSTEKFPVGAKLPTRAGLRAKRVFDDIVAVGCPLGNDPIPTRGHLSDLYHQVSSERFWMISAPTYIGNSGGGIYSADGHELLGIFSKIYTHGSVRPTVIPHMGLVTPLEEFYDWIDGEEIAQVIESDGQAVIVLN